MRFAEDRLAVGGFRELTKEEELAILQDEFNEFVENLLKSGSGYIANLLK